MDAEAEERLSYCPPSSRAGGGHGRGGREGDWCPPAELGEADGVCVMSSLLPCVCTELGVGWPGRLLVV